MEKQGLGELKRIFGERIVSESDGYYVMTLPKEAPPMPTPEFDPEYELQDDEAIRFGSGEHGEPVITVHTPEDISGYGDDDLVGVAANGAMPEQKPLGMARPMLQVIRSMAGLIRPMDMKIDDSHPEYDTLSLPVKEVESALVTQALINVEDSDIFGFDQQAPKKTASEQKEDILFKLRNLDENPKRVHWKISSDSAYYTTTLPVANAAGVMYHISGALGEIINQPWPPPGAGYPVIPVAILHEDNAEKLKHVDRSALKPLIKTDSQRQVG